MERKQFLIYVTTAAGLLPLTITQLGCASGASQSAADKVGFGVISSRDNFHRHEIRILFADVSQPPAAGKAITSSGPIHTHDIFMGMDDYRTLQAGRQVIKTSTVNARHSHSFAIQVAQG